MTEPRIHIYRVAAQSATHWHDDCSGRRMTFKYLGNHLLWSECCQCRRPAKNLVVHQYYDCTLFFCAPGKGCKGEKEIRAKARRLFLRRSEGQKRRWESSGPVQLPYL